MPPRNVRGHEVYVDETEEITCDVIVSHNRNSIINVFSVQLKERKKELAKNQARTMDQAQGTGDCGAFCAGVIFAICSLLVAYLACYWYWHYCETNLLVLKPVQFWKTQDVQLWIEDMPWASTYANMIREHNIDGNMLLSLDEESLTRFLNVSDTTHRKALLFAVNRLKHEGVKVPSSLWEYKALYPAQCHILVHGMKGIPRTTLLYMILFYHDEMFLPFAMATIPSVSHVGNASIPLISEQGLSKSQWRSLIFYAAVLPHWLVVLLAYQMFSHYFITSIIVIGTAAIYQIWEILDWVWLYKHQRWSCVSTLVKAYVDQLLAVIIFMVVWPVVPWFICDAIFYISLYLWPFFVLPHVDKRNNL